MEIVHFEAKIDKKISAEAFDYYISKGLVRKCTLYSTFKKSYVKSRQIKDDLETIIVGAAKRGGEENAGNAGLEL
jgi:hypothetical protein